VKKHPLGTMAVNVFGDMFRYCFSGEAIGAGQVVMAKAGVANHDMDLATQAAAAIGATSVSVTLGATAATVDQYADGILYVNDGAGEGQKFRVHDHLAADASATLTLNFYQNDKVAEALATATSLCGLSENKYKDVEIYDVNDVDGPAVGVAVVEVADNSYFWAQVHGSCNVLIDSTTVVLGSAVEASSAVDGSVGLADYSANTDQKPIGVVELIVAVSTDYGMIHLTIE